MIKPIIFFIACLVLLSGCSSNQVSYKDRIKCIDSCDVGSFSSGYIFDNNNCYCVFNHKDKYYSTNLFETLRYSKIIIAR